MKIVAVANHKGGVGKTTTAVNLAAALAEAGHSTLLIDLDPQANATSALGLESIPGKSLYPCMIGEASVHDKIQPTAYPNLFAITSEVDLAGCEVEIARQDQPLARLKAVLEPLKSDPTYKYVLLDCPPSLGILMTSSLAAAEAIIVPVQCEFFALEGISKILDLANKMREQGLNPGLQILGVLLTMYDARTRLSQQVMTELQSHLSDKVFKAIIPRSIRLGEAPSFGKPILNYDPSGIGAQSYRQMAAEFVERAG